MKPTVRTFVLGCAMAAPYCFPWTTKARKKALTQADWDR